jgi:hypothetical protein
MFKSQRYHAKAATFPEQAGAASDQAEKREVGEWRPTSDIDQFVGSKGAAITRWRTKGAQSLSDNSRPIKSATLF